MKEIEIISLYDIDYTVKVINAMKQYWERVKNFSCVDSPKKYNMLLLLDGCKADYKLKSGEIIKASSGDIIYTPAGSEYSVEFYDCAENGHTTHINFLLFTSSGLPAVLSGGAQVLSPDNANYRSIFNKLNNYSEMAVQCHGKMKSIMYDLLFKIGDYYRRGTNQRYSIIEKGIEYLEGGDEKNLSIKEIAAMCNVSEVYFRRLFHEYSGYSPTDYRNHARIFRAKSYLAGEELSVAEISDILGFSDVSYFIKTFKAATGVTPKNYRKGIAEKH